LRTCLRHQTKEEEPERAPKKCKISTMPLLTEITEFCESHAGICSGWLGTNQRLVHSFLEVKQAHMAGNLLKKIIFHILWHQQAAKDILVRLACCYKLTKKNMLPIR